MFRGFGLALALHALIAFALWSWSRWLGERLPWRRASLLPILAFTFVLVGLGLTMLQLQLAEDAITHADPASKASLLAGGISLAMNITAATAPASWGLDLASLVMCLVGTLYRRR